MLIIGQSFIGTDGKNPTKQSEPTEQRYSIICPNMGGRQEGERREGWGQSLQHQLEEGLQIELLVSHSGDRGTAGSTGCHPQSRFSKRPCLKGERQRARQQRSCGSLHLHHANPVLNSGQRNTKILDWQELHKLFSLIDDPKEPTFTKPLNPSPSKTAGDQIDLQNRLHLYTLHCTIGK